jgi:hypothetical protein
MNTYHWNGCILEYLSNKNDILTRMNTYHTYLIIKDYELTTYQK